MKYLILFTTLFLGSLSSKVSAQVLDSNQSVSDVVRNSQYLVIIEGDNSVGSGFIAMHHGKPMLFTNTHVLSGNSRVKARLLNGKEINLQSLHVATTYDISALGQDTIQNGMELSSNTDSDVLIGDNVVVLGNSLGAGVVTELRGKVTGVGPEMIEVDAKFVSGNSGSPVIHEASGKVIGIATFSILRTMDGFGKDSKFNSVERRFAYRLDNIPDWKEVGWGAFASESGVIDKIRERTDQIWKLAVDIAQNGEITDWIAHLSSKGPVAQAVSSWQQELGRGGNVSKSQIIAEKDRFFWRILSALQGDLVNVIPDRFSSFHRSRFDDILKERSLLNNYFDTLSKQAKNDPDFKSH